MIQSCSFLYSKTKQGQWGTPHCETATESAAIHSVTRRKFKQMISENQDMFQAKIKKLLSTLHQIPTQPSPSFLTHQAKQVTAPLQKQELFFFSFPF